MRKIKLWLSLLLCVHAALAQETFPINGVADERSGTYAFTHATIVKNATSSLRDATLLISNGKIIAAGNVVSIPAGATVIDCSGKFIYPSFIDIYSDYGIPAIPPRQSGFNFFSAPQLNSNQKGAYGWNQAIHTETDASKLFTTDEAKAKTLRDAGFGTVLTHVKDGIARGTGAVVLLGDEKENKLLIKENASAHYSFSKGTSGQSYPSSAMGSIALLRQTYLDAAWYKNTPHESGGFNISLQNFNNEQKLPQIFEATDKWTALRADRIGDEFGVQYIIKAGGNEYQRIKEIAATKASFILPLNFPQAQDVEDPNDARFVSLEDLKDWEAAPANPAYFEKNNIPFAITTADLKDIKSFLSNLRKAIEYGLSDTAALNALTATPAKLLGVYDKTGSIEVGKIANFLVTTGPVFAEKTSIVYNYVNGNKYGVKEDAFNTINGTYNLALSSANGNTSYVLDVKGNSEAKIVAGDTASSKFSFDGKLVKLSFTPFKPKAAGDTSKTKKDKSEGTKQIRLSGVSNGNLLQGTGVDTLGNPLTWVATFNKVNVAPSDSSKKKTPPELPALTYPFGSYGFKELPKQETILFKNATVWTNEAEGVLLNSDVLISNGKIAAIGKNLSSNGAKVIDATGKHVTPGVIDEHSHIAASSINEGGQSVTSEVRIADNLDPDDINIYRQLSGGVTTSHILHGSANTIGGQTQLIKLRWGANDTQLKFEGADPFIKFALGENVKRTFFQANNRFPDTRMGVEQVLVDAFQRASDYQKALKRPDAKNVRRDLELDALVEILNKKRFITCHSYVQSEITAMIRVAERYGFTLNTFTHILEGYKVADKMKAHGANASTFSDWFAYKTEVQDAIAYNAYIMNKVGLNVAINSDDAEQARRLNQEAAKSVKYGGLSEEEALKLVTLNPAKMLHVDNKVGSLKVGKDADVVLWSDNPLSIYAKAEKTIVDGIVYFDRERDLALRKYILAERNRIIQKLIDEKKGGGAVTPAKPAFKALNNCGDHADAHGILDADDNR
jgi:imidazolonepropionase-like amidohydrolase